MNLKKGRTYTQACLRANGFQIRISSRALTEYVITDGTKYYTATTHNLTDYTIDRQVALSTAVKCTGPWALAIAGMTITFTSDGKINVQEDK